MRRLLLALALVLISRGIMHVLDDLLTERWDHLGP